MFFYFYFDQSQNKHMGVQEMNHPLIWSRIISDDFK